MIPDGLCDARINNESEIVYTNDLQNRNAWHNKCPSQQNMCPHEDHKQKYTMKSDLNVNQRGLRGGLACSPQYKTKCQCRYEWPRYANNSKVTSTV